MVYGILGTNGVRLDFVVQRAVIVYGYSVLFPASGRSAGTEIGLSRVADEKIE